MSVKLINGVKNNFYYIQKINLPAKTTKRLEALGMTAGTKITVLNKKRSAVLVEFRGTRFALGKYIAENINIINIEVKS